MDKGPSESPGSKPPKRWPTALIVVGVIFAALVILIGVCVGLATLPQT